MSEYVYKINGVEVSPDCRVTGRAVMSGTVVEVDSTVAAVYHTFSRLEISDFSVLFDGSYTRQIVRIKQETLHIYGSIGGLEGTLFWEKRALDYRNQPNVFKIGTVTVQPEEDQWQAVRRFLEAK